MKRRAFVASALATTAGCVGAAGTRTTETTETTTDTTGETTGTTGTTAGTTGTLDGTRTVSVASVSQGTLGDAGLTAAVSVPRDTISEAHTARVRMTLTAESAVEATDTVCWPGNAHQARRSSDDTPLLLLRGDPPDGVDDCWTLPPENLHLGKPCTHESVSIAPDDPFVRAFSLLNHPEADGCFPPGRYRVRDGFTWNDETVAWSFDLRVEN